MINDKANKETVLGGGVFRDKALEEVSAPDDLEQALRLSSPLSWILLSLTGVLILGAIIWSTLADAPIKVSGQGILLSRHGVVEVVVGTEGRLTEIAVEKGSRVKAGEVVATIDQADIALEMALAKAELDTARDHYERVKGFHTRERTAKELLSVEMQRAAKQSVVMAREREALLRTRAEGLARLKRKGMVAQDKVIANKVEISQVIDQIAQQENQVRTLQLEDGVNEVARERELLDISQNIDQLTRKHVALEEKFSRKTGSRARSPGGSSKPRSTRGNTSLPACRSSHCSERARTRKISSVSGL